MKTPNPFSITIPAVATLLFLSTCSSEGPRLSQLEKDKFYCQTKEQKLDGPAQFAEFHALIRTRDGEEAPTYEPGYRLKEFRKSIANRRGPVHTEALPWTERGPGNVGGRTRGVWVHPSDPTHLTWLVGAVGGGIWKTEDGGASWRHLTEGLANLATSTIAGSSANPNVLYAGTGEGFSSREIAGNGIWKSTDGGESWMPLESTLNAPEFAHIMRMAVNPENENEIVVATRAYWRASLGIGDPISYVFKSLDGGLSWEEKLRMLLEETPTPLQSSNAFVVEHLVTHPYHFDTIYTGINGVGVKRSLDGGNSWETVYNAEAGMKRIELAISPTSPNVLFFAADTDPPKLFQSIDHGENWSHVRTTNAQYVFGNWMGSQGWYNNTIAVHPFDPNTAFVGGAGPILKITVTDPEPNPIGWVFAVMEPVTDGYLEYTDRFDSSTKGVHVDHHNLIMIPVNEETGEFYIIDANDGGIAFSTDGGDTFTQTGDTFNQEELYSTFSGYNTSQFYGVDKMNGASRYVGGTQDNGCWISPADADAASRWVFTQQVGDGFEVAWHYHDPNKILISTQLGRIFRSDDGGNTWSSVINPNGSFITRIANSKINPDLVFRPFPSGLNRSENFGEDWELIDMPEEWIFNGASNVSISLANPLAVWSGSGLTASNRMAVSRNGGLSFTPTNFYEQAVMGSISGLATHPSNPATAYALFSIADGPKILRTTDFGETWEDLSGFNGNVAESSNGFPDVATYSLLVMPFDTNRIWAGTEIGLFESLDGGESWSYADNGLPPVSVWEMKIVNDEIVLATHGRGVWSVSMPELEGYEPPEPVALTPQFELVSSGIDGRIAGNYNLLSVYDSSYIIIEAFDGDAFQEIYHLSLDQGNEPVEGSFSFLMDELPEDTLIRAKVSLIAFKNGLELTDIRDALIFEVEEETLAEYRTDFDDGRRDFARLGFNIYQEGGFESKALHSPHPYLGFDQTYIAVLQYPIIVSATNPVISFDEIAMVEPGDAGSEFGSSNFYDYVLIDGTRDRGLTWDTIQGYDVRWSESWLDFYSPFSSTINPGLMENHIIDLSTFFEPGDTIFLRFVLQSDPFLEAWGWVIDNLNVQGDPFSGWVAHRLEMEIGAYPNPTMDKIHLNYTLSEKQTVRIDLFSISGQHLSILEQGIKPAGEHQTEFDGSQLKPGVYLFRLEIGEKGRAVKWIKL